MGTSRSFGSQSPAKPHLVRGSGGLAGELNDLRQDLDESFNAMEDEVQGKAQSQSNLRYAVLPTAADTMDIGADLYEWVAAIGDEAAGNIGILIAADAPLSLLNAIAAINGVGYGAVPQVASARPTEAVVASAYNTDYLHVEGAVQIGGPAEAGPKPALVLASSLTSAVTWDHEELGRTGGDSALRKVVHVIDVDAINLAADFDIVVPGVPVAAQTLLVTDAADDPAGTTATLDTGYTLVQARNAVTVDLDGATTDPVATDKVYVEITYLAA